MARPSYVFTPNSVAMQRWDVAIGLAMLFVTLVTPYEVCAGSALSLSLSFSVSLSLSLALSLPLSRG